MAMKILIRGRIFPKGGGDDAEHPTIIPMKTTPSSQLLSGPMTRARARDIGAKVNSLLFEYDFDGKGTWMLPHNETLCILRYEEDDREGPRKQPQDQGRGGEGASTKGMLLDSPELPACPDLPAGPELTALR